MNEWVRVLLEYLMNDYHHFLIQKQIMQFAVLKAHFFLFVYPELFYLYDETFCFFTFILKKMSMNNDKLNPQL